MQNNVGLSSLNNKGTNTNYGLGNLNSPGINITKTSIRLSRTTHIWMNIYYTDMRDNTTEM